MEAFGREFTQGTVEAEFRRTSGTPYSCERVNVMLGPGLMLPEGTLQQARRELIRALTVKRAEPPQVETGRLIPFRAAVRRSPLWTRYSKSCPPPS